MKRLSLVLLIVALWSPVLFAGAEIFFVAKRVGPELIINGSFEAQNTTGWTENGSPTITYVADPTDGVYCINVVRGTQPHAIYQGITTEIGATYRIKASCKSPSAAVIKVVVYDDAWASVKDEIAITIYDAWTNANTTFVATSTTTYIAPYFGPTAGDVGRLDFVSVARIL